MKGIAMNGGRLVLHRYHTSVDRVGGAIAVGGGLCGVLAAVLLGLGGTTSPVALALALVLGTLVSALAITALGGPVWLLLHINGRRGPGHALVLAGAIGFLLFFVAQTHGFGLGAMPLGDKVTTMLRWASAVATSLVLSLIAGLIGLAMWRVAYFRIR